jgi:chromosome segregation ATPase
MALGIVPGDPDLVTKAFANLKTELDKERAARIASQVEIDVLTRAVQDLKIFVDRFAAQIPTLEDKIKHLKNKVVDGLNEVRARELCLERTTRANEDYKKQNARLTKKLESKSFDRIRNIPSFLNYFLSDPSLTRRVRC